MYFKGKLRLRRRLCGTCFPAGAPRFIEADGGPNDLQARPPLRGAERNVLTYADVASFVRQEVLPNNVRQ